jgi:tetratricopeptide (TPR) repeat protein
MAAGPQPESRIFISYRREDSSGHVLALLPALKAHFGADRIFKDTDNIPAGVDFVKFIRRELESCAVLLAIIGREWLTIRDPRQNQRRLDNPEDFLRVEVATALKNENIRVIPVLVERGVMPAAEDLPPDLTALTHRNAIELSDVRWDSDVRRLVEAIQRACAPPVDVAGPAAQRPELQNLQKRRAREIAMHLTAAREALEAASYEAALWACEKALVLDPQAVEALELMDRARKAIDQHKIDGWLSGARAALAEEDLARASELIDQTLALEPGSLLGLALRQELLRMRRDRERDREQARLAEAAVTRARASLEEEDFEGAVRHAEDALALDPELAPAQEVRAQRSRPSMSGAACAITSATPSRP